MNIFFVQLNTFSALDLWQLLIVYFTEVQYTAKNHNIGKTFNEYTLESYEKLTHTLCVEHHDFFLIPQTSNSLF